jgi:hypothetical protein
MSITDIARSVSNVQGAIGGVENFVRSIASMFGVDVVGIFDNDTFEQLWITARPMKASMSVHQKIMDHPIESGAIVSDFAIILPVEIELPLLLTGQDYQQTYQEIQQYIQNRTLVYVALRVGGSMNMLIESVSHDETAEVFDAAPIVLKLREIQLVTVQYQSLPAAAVATPSDQSTTNRGTVQPQSSILYNVTSYLKGIF